MTYLSSVDADGRVLYCFVTPDGIESPTLHVRPGDTLNVTLTNGLAAPPAGAPRMEMSVVGRPCGDAVMDASSVNMHFHGTNTSPTCHSDEVIRTLVNSGGTFRYQVKFPSDEPPGLYWYHPHVHGQAEAAVLGGATGAIIVDGLQNIQPEVAGLPERVLVVRDQIVAGQPMPGGRVPSWDLTLDYVPIAFPAEIPAILRVKPGRRELWRVVNASADDILDLRLKYDGLDQQMEVVGLDGVPTGSQDGTGQGKSVWTRRLLIPTAGRAEFIVTTPADSVVQAILVAKRVDVGPAGDNDPTRTLAVLKQAAAASGVGMAELPVMPPVDAPPPPPRFASLDGAKITAERNLYFSEVFEDSRTGRMPTAPHPFGAKSADDGPIQFYITETHHKPVLFSPDNPPAITTTQGAVEAWTIENRTEEVHEFHIHQIHFKLIKRDGVTLPPDQQQYLDTAQIPFWSGHGPWPSITVLMDFRGPVVGDFVYHCHILEHEDGGMMAIIRVNPKPGAATGS
ncbi:MAG: multicopper oxidase domain-containing protein [Caulobacteraceae bacterium]